MGPHPRAQTQRGARKGRCYAVCVKEESYSVNNLSNNLVSEDTYRFYDIIDAALSCQLSFLNGGRYHVFKHQ